MIEEFPFLKIENTAVVRHGNERNRDGDFLFDRFSIADCMYGPVVSRFVTYGIELPSEAKAYVERMMSLPAMRDWGRAAQAEIDAGTA